MAKKRQQDFAKAQLKPGRPVGKRKNVTNTSFKAKKIVVQNKAPQNRSSRTILDCLQLMKRNSSAATKTAVLEDLDKLIGRNPDSLPTLLSDVLESVLKLLLAEDIKLRNATREVVNTILKKTDHLQIQSFAELFINVLSCAMTHSNMVIKEFSLSLLRDIISSQPDLVCHSTVVLNNLLQMLIGLPRKRTQSQMPTRSALPVTIIGNKDFENWQVSILDIINLFLVEVLKNKSVETDIVRDEQDIYWDCESPLYVTIYASGGLKPFDIEKSYSNSIASHEVFDDTKEILTLLSEFVFALPAIFIEMAPDSKRGKHSEDRLSASSEIEAFNTLFQVLCRVTECLKIVPSENLNYAIKKFLDENIFGKARFPFCERNALHRKSEQAPKCVQLNLALCFLYCTYLVDSVKDRQYLNDRIFNFLEDFFKMSLETKYLNVSMLLKIMNVLLGMKKNHEVSEFIHNSIIKMSPLLKMCDFHKDRSCSLIAFFAKMSLDVTYSEITETDILKYWYIWLLSKLEDMSKTGDVDKNILGIIKKVANRRFGCFQKLLMADHFFSTLRALLKFDNDDVRDTAIFLIYNMKDISSSLLDNLAHIILMDCTFPTRFVVRLIRVLTYRFSEKPVNKEIPEASIYCGKGLIDIVQFLLNIAVDSFNINNMDFIDFEVNEYTKALKIIKDVTSYSILPSLHWKKHSVIFEVCDRFLKQLPEGVVNEVAMSLFQEILDSSRILPMHTVIAILKLNKREMKEKYYLIQINDLIFTALLTTSVLTHIKIEDDWYQYNVIELTNSMQLDSQIALETLSQVEFMKDDDLEGIVVYHMLRVCKFYIERELLRREDFESVLGKLDTFKEKCSDKSIGRQPLFISLYHHFTYYM